MSYFTTPGNTTPFVMATEAEDIDSGAQGSDRVILASVVILMLAGLLAVYSSIAFFAEINNNTPGSMLIKHSAKVGVAFLVMILFSKIDYHFVLKLSKFALIVSWILLLVVAIYGAESGGAKRWINIVGFSFQPSSLAIVALLSHLVMLIDKKQEYIKDFKLSFMPIMFWVVFTCGLIGIQDFSTAGVLMGISLIILFIGRINIVHLLGLVMIAFIGGATLISVSPERQNRIDNYIEQVIDIKSDAFALDEGYQSQQAHIAFARGELMGVGIGKSSQRNFLPAPYNDFIFAIIGEEYGLAGAIFILSLYCIILFRGFVFVARRAIDTKGMLLATAFTLIITLYAFVNAAVATGLFPVTGLPMPFVSYGGSSLMFSGLMMGIILNISKHKRNA
jgi:cell division protein FtsW